MKIMYKLTVIKLYNLDIEKHDINECELEEELFTKKFNDQNEIIEFVYEYFGTNLENYLFSIGSDDFMTTLEIENNDDMVLLLSVGPFIAEDTEVADEYDDEESSEYKIIKK